jgi:hypothetical protein
MNRYASFFSVLLCVVVVPTFADEPETKRVRKCPSQLTEGRIIMDFGKLKPPKVIKQVRPVWPDGFFKQCPTSKETVIMEVLIDEQGKVECVEVLECTCNLNSVQEAAAMAVKQWEYEISRDEKGKPVACYIKVTVSFQLH